MPSFDSIESLLSHIEGNVEDVLRKDVAKDSTERLKKNKQEYWYDRHDPTEYERTYEFLNSGVSLFEDNKSSKTKKVLSVFTETNNTFMPKGHLSWTTGTNQNKNIPLWLEYGNFSSLYNYDGSYYYHYTLIEIEDNLKINFIEGLKKRGIDSY